MGEKDTIELLRHSRHDWLNHIQLIKGYISLGKTEKVKEIIDDIVKTTEHESKLSNLNLPQFAELLLTYNWQSPPPKFAVKFEVIGNPAPVNSEDEHIFNWFRQFLIILNDVSSEMADNWLLIRIILENHNISFFIQFNGILTHIDSMKKFLMNSQSIHKMNDLFIEMESIQFNIKIQ